MKVRPERRKSQHQNLFEVTYVSNRNLIQECLRSIYDTFQNYAFEIWEIEFFFYCLEPFNVCGGSQEINSPLCLGCAFIRFVLSHRVQKTLRSNADVGCWHMRQVSVHIDVCTTAVVASREGLEDVGIISNTTVNIAETGTNERKHQGKNKVPCSSLEKMRDQLEEWKMGLENVQSSMAYELGSLGKEAVKVKQTNKQTVTPAFDQDETNI